MDKLSNIKYKVIKTNKKKTYINIECALDIETTSTYLNGDKFAFMYIWTIGIGENEYLITGRTWDELQQQFIDMKKHFKLESDRLLVCYVHNLGYEFQFMRKYFNWVDVFTSKERKPLKATCDLGIEFRDSLMLSGYALSTLAKNLQDPKHQIKKLVGDLDYKLVRHSLTPLSPEELEYCYNDVIIILYYINEQIKMYGNITQIPLTNTGRVRNYVRHNCYQTSKSHKKSSSGKYGRYRKLMEDLTLTPESYTQLKRAFMGGFTHANANKTLDVIHDVSSIDFTSSYPSVMVSEKFPMSRPIPTTIKSPEHFKSLLNNKNIGLVFDINFENIISKLQTECYISISKCLATEKAIEDNGRVFSADRLITTITDIDFEIIENVYSFESYEVKNVQVFHLGYLPKDIIKSVLSLYSDKTTLKGVEGKEVEYMVSKGMLNSTYGMTVTDVTREEIEYNDDWEVRAGDVPEQINDYNQSKSRFLYYPWGVFITAYARRNLWTGIINIGEDYIYSDTDSIKFTNYNKHIPYIERYNSIIILKMETMLKHYSLPLDLISPRTIDNVVKTLGVWDYEGTYKRFKTLGAKRYLVEFEDNTLELTLSGLSKRNGINYMLEKSNNDNTKVFDMFNNELYIPPNKTGKNSSTYIDSEMLGDITDYKGVTMEVKSLSSIHLESAEFTLSISKQYIDFLDKLKQGYLFVGQSELRS